MTIKSTEGALLLFEAMMEQARKDLTDKNEKVRKDAETFIDKLQKAYAEYR